MDAWADIARQYVKHMDATFPDVPIDYEIWNEPNTEAFCSGTRPAHGCIHEALCYGCPRYEGANQS